MIPVNFIDPSVEFADDMTRVWHFAVILGGCRIGKSCSIGNNSEIGRGTILGDRARIAAHVFLPPNSMIGSGVFIGPGTVFTDDRYPKVPAPGDAPYRAEPPWVGDFASIGAGCTILPGVRIGHHAMIGAGSVVAKDVAPNERVYGERAHVRIRRETNE